MPSKTSSGPDEAIGWLIAMSCFFINFIMAGLARTAGVLYVALIDIYGVSRESATTPFSIRVSVRNMTGPLIGLLGQKYGIRKVTTVGGFVAALGSILCYFAPNIFWITMFWGAIHGFGFGLSTVLHMMMIGQYFDKYKASALGLGYSGDCFGTFGFPVIIEFLLATYDVKGTFLILGGLVLHVIPLALILKKPPWLKKQNRSISISRSIRSESNVEKVEKKGENKGFDNKAFEKSEDDYKRLENVKPVNVSDIESSKQKVEDSNSYHKTTVENKKCDELCLSKQESLRHYENNILNRCEKNICRSNSALSPVNHFLRQHELEHHRDNMERHGSLPPVFEKSVAINLQDDPKMSQSEVQCEGNEGTQSPAFESKGSLRKRRTSSFMENVAHELVNRLRSASFASQVAQEGYVASMSFDSQSQNEEPVEEENTTDYYDSIDGNNGFGLSSNKAIVHADDAKVKKASLPTNAFNKSHKGPSTSKILLRTNLNPLFILISLTMAFYAFLFVGVLTIIIDYAVDHGISHDSGKFLIIGFSVTDLFGRLTFGQVIDRKLLKMKTYAGMTMLFMGILVIVIPLYSSFYYLMICMCTYGFVQGGTAIMFPILVTTYMNKNQESIAMGCLNFYGGLLMLALAPMIGFFRDNIGSYDGVFYILGGTVAAVGLMWQLEPCLLRYQNRKSEDSKPPLSTKL
ncbi:monocarboxylate transporter 12-B-like isoform X2 [Uloborus diversus]|uniref:monocarboxylate transporter 12-B-like isoform X2 n=1 Tax=Uloborus diversus TaxID=327109 RepID=UPI00240939D1|nr:monocarboxylate transporter 12-B-like isoform X2 [Uloborus diversus]